MQNYDILIIGGGPAGSSLAWGLKDSGLKIAILDKQTFPRQKVCAGWVTPEVMKVLDIDLDDYAQGRILQPINAFKVSQLGQKQVAFAYDGDPVSYGIRRIEFDDYLLQRCKAELLLNESFDGMENNDEGWLVNGKYQAKLVVGAGGHYCPVARAIGTKGVSEVNVVAQEAEFEMSPEQKAECPIKEEVPELFFTPDLKGYGWIFRKGDYLNIGLGREDKNKLPSHVKDFCSQMENAGKIPKGITAKYNGHAYLLYHHSVRKFIDDNVMLIGDAAGLAYPQSGEGIRPAVESSLIAAEVIRQCSGDYTKEKLAPYQEQMIARFGERLPAPGFLEKLPNFIKRFIASQLMKTRWFNKNIVTTKWFLQAHQKPLNLVRK